MDDRGHVGNTAAAEETITRARSLAVRGPMGMLGDGRAPGTEYVNTLMLRFPQAVR